MKSLNAILDVAFMALMLSAVMVIMGGDTVIGIGIATVALLIAAVLLLVAITDFVRRE